MENLKRVYYYNLPKDVNTNFDTIETAINSLEAGQIEPADTIAALGATTAITTVPGTLADAAAVQAYLSGANVIPNIQTRLLNLENKLNAIIAALKTAGVIEE